MKFTKPIAYVIALRPMSVLSPMFNFVIIYLHDTQAIHKYK